MYLCVVEDLGVTVPFTSFETDVLKSLNIAPSQLQPNNWAFLRGFHILCEGLGFEPSLGIFLSFYGTNGVDKGS